MLKVTSLGGAAFVLHAIGCQSRDVMEPKKKVDDGVLKVTEQNVEVPLELEDETLLNHGVIRVGIVSNAAEKQRIRGQIKRALRIVLADPDQAKAYRNSKTVEHLVVPDIAETLRQIIASNPEQFQHVDVNREISQSAHGDAYTVAVETVNPEGELLAIQNFMLMHASLIEPDNFPQLVVTLDHECGHILLRGKQMHRREEELQVYTAGIARMERVAKALNDRSDEDAEIGRRILNDVLPVHRQRLNAWRRIGK